MPKRYKLTIINSGLRGDHEVCVIGTFGSEEELIKWAEENKGELAKC